MKFNVGDKVTVRENLEVNAEYFNEDRKTGDVFTALMVKNVGKEAEVIKVKHGKYVLDIDPYHAYTDAMLEKLDNVRVAKPIRVNPYVLEAEKLIEHMLELIPEQRINYALETGNKKLFEELTKKHGR